MRSDCLVSIIIPVYNVKPYLEEALDSVLHQTYANLEIIIIDDGSTDGSGTICNEYSEKDTRIRVVHQENRGLSAARNTGLELIHGEVIAFVDPDDVIHPDFVSSMLDAMNREKVDIVMCLMSIHTTTGKIDLQAKKSVSPNARKGRYDRISILHGFLEQKINSSVCNKLFLSELWTNIRFPDGHDYEDYDTIYKVFEICNAVYVIDQPFYYYRKKRPGSIQTVYSLQRFNDRVIAYSHFNSFVEDHIPDIFSSKDRIKVQNSYLHMMVCHYLEYRNRAYTSTGGEELRYRIIEEGRKIDVKNCDLKTRAAYFMLQYYPELLVKLNSIHRFFKVSLYKIIGKTK